MVSAIVLAAGLSKRMGTANKLLLPYQNKTIVEVTLENIIVAGIQEIIVITGHEHEKVEQAIQQLPVKIIYNPFYEKGMTSSIQTGVEHSTGNGCMICLADMFTIIASEYSFLAKEFEQAFEQNKKCICVPRFNSEKGNPVIFSSFYRDQILQHTDMEGCKTIVQTNTENIHWINMSTDHILQDLDYPEDYKKLSKE